MTTLKYSHLPPGVLLAMSLNDSVTYVSVNGLNDDADCTAADEDIWHGGGLYTGFPTGSAETLTVTSASDNDTSAGTGARQLRIYGLDSSGSLQTEVVSMNGTSGVTTTNTFSRCYLVRVISSGSGGSNAGDITVKHTTTTANIFAVMPAGQSRTKLSNYTIPTGKRGMLTAYWASMSNNSAPGTTARARVAIYTRESGTDTWEDRRSLWLSSVTGISRVELGGAITLPSGTDVVLRVESGASADNLSVIGSYDLFIVTNG